MDSPYFYYKTLYITQQALPCDHDYYRPSFIVPTTLRSPGYKKANNSVLFMGVVVGGCLLTWHMYKRVMKGLQNGSFFPLQIGIPYFLII